MTQLGVQFGQDCACGGRTGHPHNARSVRHEASKRHQRWISQNQTTTQTTPKTDATTSASSSPPTSSMGGKAC